MTRLGLCLLAQYKNTVYTYNLSYKCLYIPNKCKFYVYKNYIISLCDKSVLNQINYFLFTLLLWHNKLNIALQVKYSITS